MKLNYYLLLVLIFLAPILSFGQYTNFTDVQGKPAGIYTFNFGAGDFQAYKDADDWILWAQYVHKGGTNPDRKIIQPGNNLPIYDNSPLGTDLSTDPTKWGHASQAFAASIPDSHLWLRFEGQTSNHTRKLHFETPVIGRFQSNDGGFLAPEISYRSILRNDHTAYMPEKATSSSNGYGGDNAVIDGSFQAFGKYNWGVRISASRWNMDDITNTNGTLINFEHSTIHRVWVKPKIIDYDALLNGLNQLENHINGVQILTEEELTRIKNIIYIYVNHISERPDIIQKAISVVQNYDTVVGPLFINDRTNSKTTQAIFYRDPDRAPGKGLERAIFAIQQGLFDFAITTEGYIKYPDVINGIKYNSCAAFPGDVAPPTDPNVSYTVPIRANFADPKGINPYYNMNGDGTEHAYRPTGLYLAPGSVSTITVPQSLVGKDYYIRVGAHEWDLSIKDRMERFDRISKKFAINSNVINVFNPFGGAIAILVPYGASDGIVDVSVTNVVEAPFYSIKSFYTTPNFATEINKPAPWAVFETDNVMYTLPKHLVLPQKYNVEQTLKDWDAAMKGVNYVFGRQITGDKHDLYMIADEMIRDGANSVGYPMSNFPINYMAAPSHTSPFVTGPNKGYGMALHEFGHGYRISKFVGERESIVNFLYVAAMGNGLGQDIDLAFTESFSPITMGLDYSALDRMIAPTFGFERDKSDTPKDEVRYQKRGYAFYAEIAKLFGWCALKNFWEQEGIDFENGIDHGVNDQDNDDRIVRMCIAAETDLRPLFEFYGVMVKDVPAVEKILNDHNLVPSQAVYNRLNEFFNVIPKDNAAFVESALAIHTDLYTEGPTRPVDYGVGFYYQKSLTYNEAEADKLKGILQSTITKYYPNGTPTTPTSQVVCFSDTGVDPDPTCLNANGDFSSGVTNWSEVWKQEGVLANRDASSGEMAVTGITGATADWHVQLETYYNFQEGETYIINFDARADVSGNLIIATREAGGAVVPENYKVQAIGTTMSNYSIEYVHFGSSYTAGQVLFYLGNFGSVYIDNVCIVSGQTLNSNQDNDIQNQSFLIYPNPTNDYINISVFKKDIKNVNLSLYNLNGQSMKVNAENTSSGKWTIDLNGVSSGIYLLKINADNDIVYKKIVVK